MKNKRKKLYICILCIFMCYSTFLVLNAGAVVQVVKNVGDFFTFYRLILYDSDNTGYQTSDISVETNGNWSVGTTRVFASVPLSSNEEYQAIFWLQPDDDLFREEFTRGRYRITMTMYLYNQKNGDSYYYSPSSSVNMISAIGTTATGTENLGSSSATVKESQYGNATYIEYQYRLELEGQFDKLEIYFAFNTNTLPSNTTTVINFFGMVQFDDLRNPQIDNIESAIQGNPAATMPPIIEENQQAQETLYNDVNNLIDQWASNIVEDNYNDNLEQISNGMYLVAYINNMILDLKPVFIVVSISLFIMIAKIILRL